MATTDPIADMLTRIRNANILGKEKVILPHSKIKAEILRVLKDERYISDYKLEEEKTCIVTLRQGELKKLIRVSKPGQRVYSGKDRIPVVLQGKGLVVISTPKGVMSGKEAKKKGLGGEVLCQVW